MLPSRLRACMVAPTKIIAGLGLSLGIDVLEVEGATGDYRTQFHRKAEAIAGALTKGRDCPACFSGFQPLPELCHAPSCLPLAASALLGPLLPFPSRPCLALPALPLHAFAQRVPGP